MDDIVLGYFDSLSNWGRWGADDELGTLNHIDADARRRGADAVRHGLSVSCAWEIAVAPGQLDRTTFSMPRGSEMAGVGSGDVHWGTSAEQLSFTFHGGSYTHVDSPCHMFWDGHMYNGRPAELVDAEHGAAWGAVTAAAHGMVTRGVLLDVAAARGVDRMAPGEGATPTDLEAAERRQGVRVEPGDAVLLRTGDGARRKVTGENWADPTTMAQPGWHASCLPWLHERRVAYIGCDTAQDVQPSGFDGIYMPIHSVGLVAMGLWLVDNCDLEACAATATELGQWDFLLSVAPIRFAGTSGSPVNPIATF